MSRRPSGRNIHYSAIAVLCALVAIGLVLMTPVVLAAVPTNDHTDWERLSNIGQTYGAASAVLSVLALGGVAVSLYLQGRDARSAREQGLRGLHMDLLKMAMENPLYLSCWGPIDESMTIEQSRRHIYCNLVVSHWQMMWEVRALGEPHLRALAQQFFAGEPGRRFWAVAGGVRTEVEGNRRTRRFHEILSEEYALTGSAGLAVSDSTPSTPAQRAAEA